VPPAFSFAVCLTLTASMPIAQPGQQRLKVIALVKLLKHRMFPAPGVPSQSVRRVSTGTAPRLLSAMLDKRRSAPPFGLISICARIRRCMLTNYARPSTGRLQMSRKSANKLRFISAI
jgi:hypothetical protein